MENLKPKNPRHTKVSWSFPRVLTSPGLSSPPTQVSLWLANCKLRLKSALSNPVPHGKWLCPQPTEQTSVWLLGQMSKGSWTANLRPTVFCSVAAWRSCILSGHRCQAWKVWAPCNPPLNLITPHGNYLTALFISWVGKQLVSLHRVPTDGRGIIEALIACPGTRPQFGMAATAPAHSHLL